MKKVVDVATMRISDAETIRGGISGRELMRRAGVGIFESYPWKGPVAIVCGEGNNAGDGYVLATCLHAAKIPCTLFLLSDRFSPDGAYYYGKCKEIGIETRYFTAKDNFSDDAEIVDCIYGTGFHGAVTGLAEDCIKAINNSGKTVISADINSGLCGDNGISSLCVRSTLTVSIGAPKFGHFLGSAKDVIGDLKNIDIGIELHGKYRFLAESTDFSGVFQARKQDSHKGSYGYVSIMGGCTEYAGAVKLANISCAALRAGCGVAKLILPQGLESAVSPHLLESTLALLPTKDGKMIFDPEALARVLHGQKALAVGMGWGASPEYEKILSYILQHYAISLVIDADGLNTLSRMDKSLLKNTACRVLLTPHMREMERLSGASVEDIRRDPVGIAERFAAEYGVCLLLKGACSVITDGETTYLVDRGCAGMATAGSGDVLSGILVGLLGFSDCSPLTAACGAYIAGLAGELAEKAINPVSMLASDTVAHIPEAISRLLQAL